MYEKAHSLGYYELKNGCVVKHSQEFVVIKNIKKFKAQFGVGPHIMVPFFGSIRNKSTKWFDVQSVLVGRWGHCKELIGTKVKESGKQMQSLKEMKIQIPSLIFAFIPET